MKTSPIVTKIEITNIDDEQTNNLIRKPLRDMKLQAGYTVEVEDTVQLTSSLRILFF